MIIFGSKGTQIGSTTCNTAVCTHCQSKTFNIYTYSRYFHIFWIPIFPYQKKYLAECTHCKKTYAQKGFTPSMNEAVAQNPVKMPIWQFSGLLIFAVFVLIVVVKSIFVRR